MNANPPGGGPRLVLFISEASEQEGEVGLSQLLMEMGSEDYRWVGWTVMDGLMKSIPEGIHAAIMDLGMMSPLHRELLDKLRSEGLKVLVHLTDNRPEVVRLLAEMPGVRHLRKPASLHEVMELLESLVKSGA